MKIFALLLGIGMWALPAKWLNNIEDAKALAVATHHPILLNFSGSDWCGPCIRLRKEILDDAAFVAFADSSLVLVNADFPRSSKHRLPPAQIKINEKLADQYNPEGHFPFTLLLDESGKVLHTWDGLPSLSPIAFVQELKSYMNGR